MRTAAAHALAQLTGRHAENQAAAADLGAVEAVSAGLSSPDPALAAASARALAGLCRGAPDRANADAAGEEAARHGRDR